MKFVIVIFTVVFFMLSCEKQPAPADNEIPISTTSNEALQLFIQGRDLSENLKAPQAAALFDQAIEKDPNFARAYLYRAFSGGGYKVYRDNLSKAVELIEMVSEGEKHEILYSEAFADNDGVKEKVELDKLLELFPNDKRVHDLAGNYYFYTVQDYVKAEMHYKKVIELDPNFAPTYNSIGYMYKETEKYDDAEKSFEKYIKLIPDEANPYDSYAELLLLRGKYDESIEQYNKALKTDPEFVGAISGIGDNYVFMAQFDKAREYYQQYFDKALNLNQKMGALFLKAVSYVHEGNIDESIKTLEKRADFGVENNSPNYVVSSYLYALWALDEAGRFEDGETYLKKTDEFIRTAEMKEADRNTFKIYAGLDRSYHFAMTGDLNNAESDLKTFKQLVEQRQDPNEIQELYLRLGILETGKKNYETALDNFKKADKESPYVWFCMAVANEKAGNIEDAKKLYSKVGTYNENSMDLAIVRKKAGEKAL